MAEKTLIARVRADTEDEGTLIVASPVVGMADGAPQANVFLNPLDRIVAIKILGQRYVLRLPRDSQGRVTEVFIPNEYTPLAFNQPLVRLDPRALQTDGLPGGTTGAAQGSAGEGPEANLITVRAPSEGIFYCRPSPDAPAYVEMGSEVQTGTVLGLVEVMKCFNQIVYGAPGLPAKGKIAKIMAEDAAEVAFGQALYSVEPIE